MLARSLLLSLLVACKAKQPEADPAKVKALAKQLIQNEPGMAAVRECKDADFANTLPVTWRTVKLLASDPIGKENREADWINPVQLEVPPSFRTVLESKDSTAQRRAAAQVLRANAYLVHKVDVVNAPIALGIKELKIGSIGARAIRYERDGKPTCVALVDFTNDRKKAEWAMSVSDKTLIDPAVAQAMRDDLVDQYLKHAPGRK
jgi:hypothetical protein